jgi:hypothetical protein
MIDDGDRIDPDRTKATIQRSLAKANSRRVVVIDLEARIEAHLQNDNAAERHWNCDNLLEEAQARIVELDGFIRTIEEQIVALEEDNRKLRVEAGYD